VAYFFLIFKDCRSLSFFPASLAGKALLPLGGTNSGYKILCADTWEFWPSLSTELRWQDDLKGKAIVLKEVCLVK